MQSHLWFKVHGRDIEQTFYLHKTTHPFRHGSPEIQRHLTCSRAHFERLRFVRRFVRSCRMPRRMFSAWECREKPAFVHFSQLTLPRTATPCCCGGRQNSRQTTDRVSTTNAPDGGNVIKIWDSDHIRTCHTNTILGVKSITGDLEQNDIGTMLVSNRI